MWFFFEVFKISKYTGNQKPNLYCLLVLVLSTRWAIDFINVWPESLSSQHQYIHSKRLVVLGQCSVQYCYKLFTQLKIKHNSNA